MFGIDSPELLVIAIVALVVIGPKELPGLLKTWGKWMAQMRGMASEFRGHVDEMVRQSELDEVKKQLTDATGGVDLKSLDPTKQIRETIQEGMAEGQKALAEAKSSFDNPLAEPESAPQIAAEVAAEPVPAVEALPHEAPVATAEPAAVPPDAAPASAQAEKPAEKPTQAAAE
jgi:sec-independent protein translocase protein TatB